MSVNLLDIVQKSARKGTLLASCEPEVKELMHQIDILLSSKQNESKSQVQSLKSQLQQREREMSSLRVAILEKNSLVEKMKGDVKRLEQQLRVQSSDHETQLLRTKSELNRLSRSYDKLKSKRGLSEEKVLEVSGLKEELEGVRAHCETQQSQITQLSQQLGVVRTHESTLQEQIKQLEEELRFYKSELSSYKSKLSEGETKWKAKLAQVETQLQLFQDSVKSRDKKILSLRTERDELKKKYKCISEDYQKLQETSVALSNDYQSYKVGVADLELQLTREQSNLQNCVAEKTQLQQQLTMSQELLENKEKLIQSLDSCYKQKLESEVNLFERKIRELQKKLDNMAATTQQETLSRKENNKLRDKRLSSLSNHSEDQPSSSAVNSSSSSNSSSSGASESVLSVSEGSKSTTKSPSPSLDTSSALRNNSVLHVQESIKRTSSSKSSPSRSLPSSLSASQTSLTPTTADSLYRVSEHFQAGMKKLSTAPDTPTSSSKVLCTDTPTTSLCTDTPTTSHLKLPTDRPSTQQHNTTLLEMFKNSLGSILNDHFDQIDQSLNKALTQ